MEFPFFEEPHRTEHIKALDIADQSEKEIYVGQHEDVEEALERENNCPCLGRKIESEGKVIIAYFKKDDFEKNMSHLDDSLLRTVATVISNEDKLLEEERNSISGALAGPPLRLMQLLVQFDNALQRREQTAHYRLGQSMVDDDIDDPAFPPYQRTAHLPTVRCDVEEGKTYVFKPFVRRSSKLEKPDKDILVYMYDEDQIMDRPAVVLDMNCAKVMGLPTFVVSSQSLFFFPIVFHVFCFL